MRRLQKGFSLVELMIVVAIIGILAAIAIPNFIAMQLKAKRSEVPGNVDGIKTAEISYDAAFDAYVTAAAHPTSIGKSFQNFDPSAAGFSTIFLDAPVEELFRRCRQQPVDRPLRGDLDEFRRLYEARRPCYLKAGLRIDTAGKDVDRVAGEVIDSLGLR